MHYTFCVSVRNNWDKYVTFCKKNCKKSDILSCFFHFTRIYLKSDKWKSQMNSRTIHRKIYDDCFKEKKFITKCIRFFFYCTVCLSVTYLSHTSEEGKNLLEFVSKEGSLKFHFFYIFSDYVIFLFRIKRYYSNNFQLFWSCYSYIFWFLEMKIWPTWLLYQ